MIDADSECLQQCDAAFECVATQLAVRPGPGDDEAAILEPYTYVTCRPGKGIRNQLLSAFNTWLNVPPEELEIISSMVDMLHNASLLVDDIEDNSDLRRAAHTIYGVSRTLNSASHAGFLANKELFALCDRSGKDSNDIEALMIEELLSLHHGQGLDILWRNTFICPSEEEYISMVNGKTSGLLRLGVRLMMAFSSTNSNSDYVPLVSLIGIFFQIRDDLMNLESDEYAENKGFAEDLSEGKFSFPMVHGIQADPLDQKLLHALQAKSSDPMFKMDIIKHLRDITKSIEYTHSVLATLEVQIGREITRLGENPALAKIIDKFRVNQT